MPGPVLIALAAVGATPPGFEARWEEMCRTSYKAYQTYIGLAGDPVEWTDRYTLSDTPLGEGRVAAADPNGVHFVDYADRVRDITPRGMSLEPGQHPFPTRYVRRGSSMQFNVAEYAHLLTTDFLLAGGRIETLTFNTPADLSVLKQKVVVNCTGYGARALWKDESVIPVRGQIAWLIPQPEVRYGLYYKHVSVLPRHDGIVVQYVGETEAWGYDDANEVASRSEAEAAIAAIAGLYGRAATRAGSRAARSWVSPRSVTTHVIVPSSGRLVVTQVPSYTRSLSFATATAEPELDPPDT